MAKTSLVENDIIDGRYLLDALKQSGFPVTMAFWWRRPDSGDWRLIIASPEVFKGPIEAYTFIQSVLADLSQESLSVSPFDFVPPFSIALNDISVAKPDESLVRLIRRVFAQTVGTQRLRPIPLPSRNLLMKFGTQRQGFSIPGVRLTQVTIDGAYIDDTFIYAL